MRIVKLLITACFISTMAVSMLACASPVGGVPGGPGAPPPPPPPPTPSPAGGGSPGALSVVQSDACRNLRFERGFVGEIGLGRRFNSAFRGAFVLQRRQIKARRCSEGVSARSAMYSAMLNAYFDVPNSTSFAPYLMTGVGVGHSSTRIRIANTVDLSGSVSRANLVWNAGIGLQMKFNKGLDFDLGYRYVDLGRAGRKTLGADTITVRRSGAHEIMAGLVYNFASTSALGKANNFVQLGGGHAGFR